MTLQLPDRPETGHKGTFGTVAIAGGSMTGQKVMLGSAAFAAKAAIRSGAGMVVFIGEKELLTHLIEMVPQAVSLIPDEKLSGSEKWQSIVIGPGLGINKQNIRLINELLSLKLPTVIDADGLNTIAEYPELSDDLHELCVLTPHPKEFERLAKSMRVKDENALAEKLNCTVILKGHKTSITDGKNSWSKEVNNPVLATGGTGDVLAGLVGGLMAQYCPWKITVFDCARLAVEIHSKAAEKWRQAHGSGGLIIDELLELIPVTMESMRKA